MLLIKAILFVLSIVLGWNAIQVAVEIAANHEPGTAMFQNTFEN